MQMYLTLLNYALKHRQQSLYTVHHYSLKNTQKEFSTELLAATEASGM